jgi:predicted ATP-grasp superfamily ATP-dependent carboligase
VRVVETIGQMFVLEINPRFWGSVHGSPRMGINFPALLVTRALELDPLALDYVPGKYITA